MVDVVALRDACRIRTSSLSHLLSQDGAEQDTKASPSWPAAEAWGILNSTLGDHLIAPLPPGAVCHPSQQSFDAAACLSVTQQWNSSIFHSNNPLSVDWPNFNDSCLPEASGFCDLSAYPANIINASTSDHVRTAVDFARENNIRLVVKATGHDGYRSVVALNKHH
ncbi:hypothetical protein PENSOL_c080G09220 [Penicillium solitum]|uniref:FAD linked oxidase N-terminal domain-containing protein n=1 Tax=Penicillium solitum TaxID=60172 RepID=A0A1V6QDQ8_9EURO|nr:uncharacterized protein PENSOL_c080G09220 [Penicillium solitum]OQD87344.1 hypothetical protein PENSOL_c080G09220 [Penicillium solitum]